MRQCFKKWKSYVVVTALSFTLGLGIAVKMDWIETSLAKKNNPEWIFGGTTPRSFSELANRVQNAVVNISTTKNLKVRRGPFYQFQEDYYQRHLKNDRSQNFKRPNSLGSGFILDKEGYILTNNHVIQGADEILVKFSDGRTFNAKVIGADSKSDLAVIKINTTEDLPTVQLGNSNQLKVGDWVVAIGNPFGLTQTVTAGILSAKGRVIGAGPYDNFLQTDASINPGNSGGPLFNLQGEVVGVNTAIIASGQGIGFAIPIDQAKVIIPQLINGGKVRRGYLGIGLQEISPEMSKKLGFKKPTGVLVAQVYEDSPAQRAGIRVGDVILSFNGNAINRSQDLPLYVSQSKVGLKAKIQLQRLGNEKEVTVKLGSLDQASGRMVPASDGPRIAATTLGIAVRDVDLQESHQHGLQPGNGVTVTEVDRQSPAASVGLQPGDLILEINDKEISGKKDFVKEAQKLKRGAIVRMYVKRGSLISYFAFAL